MLHVRGHVENVRPNYVHRDFALCLTFRCCGNALGRCRPLIKNVAKKRGKIYGTMNFRHSPHLALRNLSSLRDASLRFPGIIICQKVTRVVSMLSSQRAATSLASVPLFSARNLIFRHDGAPPHCAGNVRHFLNEQYGCWIVVQQWLNPTCRETCSIFIRGCARKKRFTAKMTRALNV